MLNQVNYRAKIFYLIRRKIFFKNWEKFYREICGASCDYPENFLPELLQHARHHVPFYSEGFAAGNTRIEGLQKWPVLSKKILKERFEDLKSRDLETRSWYLNSSGGSTGTPSTFIQDREYQEWSIAAENYYYRNILGFDFASIPKIIFWSSPLDLIENTSAIKSKVGHWLRQTTFLDSFKLSREIMENYITQINRKTPGLIKGFAGSLYLIAKFAKENNLRIHPPRWIVSGAETLRPFMREIIEEVFDCKVYDFYGSRDAGAIAGECIQGNLHIFNFNNWVEVVDEKNAPVSPGREGRVLITTLHNYSMPLIRYEIGDTVVMGGSCSCGCRLPTLRKVTGRITDHFLTRGGERIHGQFFTRLFYFIGWILEFQILQIEVDRINIFYVLLSQTVESDIQNINTQIKRIMGGDCHIDWIQVDQVPRTPHGKWLFTRSLVS
ncbi:MAG: phenylacetate--CoA ligase family protein [Nitrospinaceae bacterium]